MFWRYDGLNKALLSILKTSAVPFSSAVPLQRVLPLPANSTLCFWSEHAVEARKHVPPLGDVESGRLVHHQPCFLDVGASIPYTEREVSATISLCDITCSAHLSFLLHVAPLCVSLLQ